MGALLTGGRNFVVSTSCTSCASRAVSQALPRDSEGLRWFRVYLFYLFIYIYIYTDIYIYLYIYIYIDR